MHFEIDSGKGNSFPLGNVGEILVFYPQACQYVGCYIDIEDFTIKKVRKSMTATLKIGLTGGTGPR